MANRKEHPAGYRIKEELAHDKTRAVEMRLAGKRWDEIAERISDRCVGDTPSSNSSRASGPLRAKSVAARAGGA